MIQMLSRCGYLISIIILFSFVMALFMPLGCGPKAPLKIRDLSPVMPGDNPEDYDVYRVVSVKRDVTVQELSALLRYFTEVYIDTNRVKIYVFNDPGSVHLGISDALVATFFKDAEQNIVKQDILLNQQS